MTIRFHVNDLKPLAAETCTRLAARAVALGMGVAAEGPADAVVVLGGDGTFLRAVHEHPGVPLLGLKFGGLGYLSCVEERDFDRALATLAGGRFRVSERGMIEAGGK